MTKNGAAVPSKGRAMLGWPAPPKAELAVVSSYQSRWGRAWSWWRFRRAAKRGDPLASHARRIDMPLLTFTVPSATLRDYSIVAAMLASTVLALVLSLAVVVEVLL